MCNININIIFICIRYDEATDAYKQKCYNFYIFPQPINKNVPDRRFICQASSMDFLAKHNMDFNKVFKEGMSHALFEIAQPFIIQKYDKSH